MRNKKKITIGKTRGFLYWLARILGDVSAVKNKRVKKRIYNRALGKITGRLFK